MNRTNFYHLVTPGTIDELDFLHNSLSEFSMKYNPTYYRIDATDLMRPDMISYKCYGVTTFWWIIMSVNGVDNPLTDLVEGQLLKIPSKLDIDDFQRRYRVRRSR